MSIVRIKTHVDSETLHLPELRPMIGKNVEIVVSDLPESTAPADESFWTGKTLEQLMSEQGVSGPTSYEKLLGGWPGEINDGFEEALEQWRKDGLARQDS